jgi:hypothetical protein
MCSKMRGLSACAPLSLSIFLSAHSTQFGLNALELKIKEEVTFCKIFLKQFDWSVRQEKNQEPK